MKCFKNILYVNEASVDQASALARAVSLAENNHAGLTVIEVVPAVTLEYREETMAHQLKTLEAVVAPYRQRVPIRLEVRPGKLFLEVIRAVLQNSHDLVIKAAEDPDFLTRLFGSDDMHLLRKCPCPLWLMKPPEKDNYQSILAAVDFNPLQLLTEEQTFNQRIIDLGTSLALSDFATLHLVHVWQAFGERAVRARSGDTSKNIADYVEKEQLLHQRGLRLLGEWLRDSIGTDTFDYLAPRFHVREGSAQRVIPALATELEADLVVMGTVARTGVLGLLIGNTAETILDQLNCSVLAVKPAGFVTPVQLADRS